MSTETQKRTRVRAWKDEDDPTYIVQVGEHMYEMDSKAHMTNGVCQYAGTSADLAWTVRSRPVTSLPIGIVRKIVELAESGRTRNLEGWRE